MAVNSYENNGSYLGKTMKIQGEIHSEEYLTVEGQVEGNININKTLTIGKEGYVNGEINAEVARINGKVHGSISAASKLEISSDGKFQGTIQSDKLVIEEGAEFKGKVNAEK